MIRSLELQIHILNRFLLNLLIPALILLQAGCSISAISPQAREQDLPGQWASETSTAQVSESWLSDFKNERLSNMVSAAMDNNYRLAQQLSRVDQAREAVIVSGASRYPELTLTSSGSRRRSVFAERLIGPNDNFEIGGELSFELDLWGRLADTEKQASLNLMAEEASYQHCPLYPSDAAGE